MNGLQIKKFQKNYHIHSAHIHSFNFKNVPSEIKNDNSYEDFIKLPIVRNEETRAIWINEALDGWKDIVSLLVPLDNLPELLVRDLYKYYAKRYPNVTKCNVTTFNQEETIRRTLLCFIPEILWAHGDNEIKSRIF